MTTGCNFLLKEFLPSRYLQFQHFRRHPRLVLEFVFKTPVFKPFLKPNHPIPQFLYKSTVLDLSNNMFNRSLPFLCTEKNSYLSYLDLSSNLLSGQIPDCWTTYQQLSTINLENNNLLGAVPNSLRSIEQLGSLRLMNTSLYGEIPESLKNCSRLKLLDLGENKIIGIIPPWIGARLESLIVLCLRSNKFHGDILSTLRHLQFLQVLDLSLSNISGSIPSCLNNLTTMANHGSSRYQLLVVL
ncbi:hypothetical protein Gotri_027411 [Gossypium trilobum]|uniref:Uncharacterized protein n=1 Tax=Gossypium trilobum TaxID=34281 RepID=A0A7J9FPU8_9ROSI|nr:hypothetical protein [Gossypium trilobum]